MVTPRVEAGPHRSGFANLGGTIATSLVQAAQNHANLASVLLKQTKQSTDDIPSQVAGRARDERAANGLQRFAAGLVSNAALGHALGQLHLG